MSTRTRTLTCSILLVAVPWAALAQATFTKITNGDIVNDGKASFGCAWGDFNNDGFLDLFVFNAGDAMNNFLYQNNHDATFTRVTEGPISNDLGRWGGCAWVDFDNDGRLDLLATRAANNMSQAVLYQNTGVNTFTPMPATTIGGIVSASAGAAPAWADYDNDGFVDVFVNRTEIDWLFRNNGNGGFSRIINTPLEGLPSEGGKAAGWADYNNDGRADLFVSVVSDPPIPRLYSNLGGGNFQKVTSGIRTDGAPSYGFGWADYDNDGFLDLFLVNAVHGEASFLYHNNGDGTFTRMTSNIVGSIANDPGGFSFCTWGDYDNDGFLDLFVTTTIGLGAINSAWTSSGGNALYHNNGDGSFTRILTGTPVEDMANSVGCAWADYDNDGFLDLFIANGGIVQPENNALYHNSGNGNSWIKVRCVGTVSNRSAIGAKVRVRASLRGKTFWQLREINSGNGICQNPLEAHFGLADATKVETLRIEWPSGTVQEFHDLAAKQFLTITEPSRLQALSRLTDGSFQFSLNGGGGLQYRIDASTNLTAWSSLGSLSITNLNGTVLFADSNAAAFGRRFYRAVLGD